ncbi:hypothetical protein [Aurantivibrio plasticivorans]
MEKTVKSMSPVKLQETIEVIDSLSQEGFSTISTIARLALAQLEIPKSYRNTGDIATVLKAICSKAEVIQNCINSEAEQVGCHYVDQADERRAAAFRSSNFPLNS